MSKSLANHVGLTDAPADMYGKTLSIPDELMPSWYDLLLGRSVDPGLGPRDAKRALARAIVERYYDAAAAAEAEAAFDRLFVAHEVPQDVPEHALGAAEVHLPALLADAFGLSRSEARRMLASGGIRLDGEPLAAEPLDRPAEELTGRVLQAGKRRFVRLT